MIIFKNSHLFRAALHGTALCAALAIGTPASAMEPYLTPELAPFVTQAQEAPAASPLKALGSRASEIAMQAMGLLGIRYKYGGNSPENGLDCSGLVRYVFKEAWGTNLPRTAEDISRVGEHVAPKDLQPGDLVFYNTLRRGFSHVGIYLGNNKFIHAPSSGGQVRIESMNVGYWQSRFNGARRINEPQQN